MDVLTDLLERSRARGAAFSHTTAHGRWGITMPPSGGLAVHVFVGGQGHLWIEDPAEAIQLLPGDLVLVRGTIEHYMACTPGGATVPLAEHMERSRVPGAERQFVSGTPGEYVATFCCGAYLFDGDLCDPLLDALPDLVHVRPDQGSALRAAGDLLAREILDDAIGQQTVLDRLLDLALVHLVREHFARRPEGAPAWFTASKDPAVGAALRALHQQPGKQWSVASLAQEASLSRAAFARRFGDLLGTSPLAYLTDWRMALARERLRDSDDGLAAIAQQVGYASEFSFASAFKREHGVAPGRWRTDARARAADAA